MTKIQELFDRDIRREIREVIKVDQTESSVLLGEIEEYEATDSIRSSFVSILDAFAEVPKP